MSDPVAPSTATAVAEEESVPTVEAPENTEGLATDETTPVPKVIELTPFREPNASLVRTDVPSEVLLSSGYPDDPNTLLSSGEKEIGFFDWTRLPDSEALPNHIRFARNVDWGATSLGPIDTWCADLRQMCNLIMASPHPAAMYWGEDLVKTFVIV